MYCLLLLQIIYYYYYIIIYRGLTQRPNSESFTIYIDVGLHIRYSDPLNTLRLQYSRAVPPCTPFFNLIFFMAFFSISTKTTEGFYNIVVPTRQTNCFIPLGFLKLRINHRHLFWVNYIFLGRVFSL